MIQYYPYYLDMKDDWKHDSFFYSYKQKKSVQLLECIYSGL